MDDVLLGLVLERLDRDPLPESAADLLLAACEGDDPLADALGGTPVGRPSTPTSPGVVGEPAGAYLTSITVAGFRGIGPAATLPVAPGPGLTLVLGRNGSGKSSFAEGLEVLLTGGLRQWDDRTAVWQEGWRNLHHSGDPAIRAELLLEGKGSATVERHWAPESSLNAGQATVQVAGERRVGVDALGWKGDLVAFRPFLSHAELETFFGKPSELHDVLAAVLGLDDLTSTAERLAKSRTRRESMLTGVKKELPALLEKVAEVDDERAVVVTTALSARKWDLETAKATSTEISGGSESGDLSWLRRIVQLSIPAKTVVLEAVGELRVAAVQLDAIVGTESARSRELAVLLRAALAHHAGRGDSDCPVLCADDQLPTVVAARVVPGLCRVAVEAAFVEVARRRELQRGTGHREWDDRLGHANTTTKKASLAFFGDDDRGGEVLARLNQWGRRAGDVYQVLNKGAHEPSTGDLKLVLSDARWLVGNIRSLT
jgi:AAA domain